MNVQNTQTPDSYTPVLNYYELVYSIPLAILQLLSSSPLYEEYVLEYCCIL